MDLNEKSLEDKNNVEKREMLIKPLSTYDVIEISAWNKNIFIIKPLIPLRIAQTVWNGGGQIIIIFYAVILKQRGLTLLEVSSIFSVTFLFQFATASICGIIADKIGSAKPILLFLIIGTLSVIICILFVPELRNKSCTAQEIHLPCYNSSESQWNLNLCNACNDSNTGNLKYMKFNENVTNFNHNDTFYINLIDTLCFENCSSLCQDFLTNSTKCLTRENTLFVIYYILIQCLFSFYSTGNRFFDFIALSLATKYGSNFGKEAFISTFGEIFIVAVAAFAINIENSPDKKINYNLTFWCCTIAFVLTIISVYYTKDVKVLPSRKLKKKAWRLIRNIDTLVFIAVIFIAGNGFSFNANFHLWFLENLEASKTIIGLHSLTSSFYGILILLTSKWWIAHLGTDKIFVLGLISYSINQFGYSFLYNPWISLLLEVTTVFSFNLMWVAFVIHSNVIAPEGLGATLNAIVGTVHFGIGRSTAILGGGLLMNYFGARMAYRVFASIILVTAIFYSFYLCMKHFTATKKPEKDDDEVEEMKHMNLSNEQDV